MTKNEIVNYVVETPHNVNKRILGQQLDELQKNVSWNDLKDKPFYSETETYTILENHPVEVAEDSGGVAFFGTVEMDKPISFGDTILVIAYGKKYEGVLGGLDKFSPYFAASDNEGDIFEVGVHAENGQYFIDGIFFRGATNVTITVVHETAHKLSAKYLPGAVLVVTCDAYGEYPTSHTFAEIKAAYDAGAYIVFDDYAVGMSVLNGFNEEGLRYSSLDVNDDTRLVYSQVFMSKDGTLTPHTYFFDVTKVQD